MGMLLLHKKHVGYQSIFTWSRIGILKDHFGFLDKLQHYIIHTLKPVFLTLFWNIINECMYIWLFTTDNVNNDVSRSDFKGYLNWYIQLHLLLILFKHVSK